MSVQALAWVLEHSQASGNARLVLIAIANHADAHGRNAWPSVTQISREARVSRSTVFRSLTDLTKLEELSIQSGSERGSSNFYEMTWRTKGGCQIDTGPPQICGGTPSHPWNGGGVTGDTGGCVTGDTHNRPLTVPEPSSRGRARDDGDLWQSDGLLEALSAEQRETALRHLRHFRLGTDGDC